MANTLSHGIGILLGNRGRIFVIGKGFQKYRAAVGKLLVYLSTWRGCFLLMSVLRGITAAVRES